MMTAATDSRVGWNEQTVEVCGGPLHIAVAGSGRPIVVLPRDQGHPPKTEFLDQLARSGEVYYPWLAGFHNGFPDRWDWLTNVRDLAIVHRQMLDALGLERPVLVGLGFGGWVAAEIATMAAPSLSALVLVSAMGIKPTKGFIFDQFLVSTAHYARTKFRDEDTFNEIYGAETSFEQLEAWETDREMTERLAWKPYMYNVSLPRLLSGVDAPALILWGEQDEVVPLECAEIYKDALSQATLTVVPDCGHEVELEWPERLLGAVSSFLGRA